MNKTMKRFDGEVNAIMGINFGVHVEAQELAAKEIGRSPKILKK